LKLKEIEHQVHLLLQDDIDEDLQIEEVQEDDIDEDLQIDEVQDEVLEKKTKKR